MRHPVDFLYSLYDALVSINVPSDKARAVVDAMERDMGTTLATKQDLQPLASREDMLLFRQELQQVRHEMKAFATKEDLQAVKQDLQLIRQEVESRYVLLAREVDLIRGDVGRDLEAFRSSFTKDLEATRLSMTIRLGSMLFIGLGLLFAALRLT